MQIINAIYFLVSQSCPTCRVPQIIQIRKFTRYIWVLFDAYNPIANPWNFDLLNTNTNNICLNNLASLLLATNQCNQKCPRGYVSCCNNQSSSCCLKSQCSSNQISTGQKCFASCPIGQICVSGICCKEFSEYISHLLLLCF